MGASSTPMEDPVAVVKHTHSSPAAVLMIDDQSKLHYKLHKGTSVVGASTLVFKAIVGAGLFAIPYAFKLMGIGGALIAMFVVGWLSFYTGMVLVRVHDVIVRDTLRQDLTYVSVAQYCFGKHCGWIVYFLVVFTSVGSNGAYLVFIGTVLHSVYSPLSTLAWAGIAALAVLPLCLLRSTTFLAHTSAVGNIGVAVVVVVVLVRGAMISQIGPVGDYTMFRSDTFMEAFGIVGFLYSCATTVLVIEKSMTKRSRFHIAYQTTTWIVFFACSAFGLVNYLYYGSNVCSIIVLNLGDGGLALTAKLAIVVDLAFSYPLSVAPAREIIEKSILNNGSPYLETKRNVIRCCIVGLTFLIAFFPSFGIIVNIVGGVSVSALSFILPCLMLMQLRRFHLKAYRTQIEYLASHDREELAAATSTSVKVTATQHHHEQLPHPSQRSLPPPHQTLALTDAASGTPVEALQHENKSRMIELPQPPHHAVRDSSGATHAAANHAPKPSFVRERGASAFREIGVQHTPDFVAAHSGNSSSFASAHDSIGARNGASIGSKSGAGAGISSSVSGAAAASEPMTQSSTASRRHALGKDDDTNPSPHTTNIVVSGHHGGLTAPRELVNLDTQPAPDFTAERRASASSRTPHHESSSTAATTAAVTAAGTARPPHHASSSTAASSSSSSAAAAAAAAAAVTAAIGSTSAPVVAIAAVPRHPSGLHIMAHPVPVHHVHHVHSAGPPPDAALGSGASAPPSAALVTANDESGRGAAPAEAVKAALDNGRATAGPAVASGGGEVTGATDDVTAITSSTLMSSQPDDSPVPHTQQQQQQPSSSALSGTQAQQQQQQAQHQPVAEEDVSPAIDIMTVTPLVFSPITFHPLTGSLITPAHVSHADDALHQPSSSSAAALSTSSDAALLHGYHESSPQSLVSSAAATTEAAADHGVSPALGMLNHRLPTWFPVAKWTSVWGHRVPSPSTSSSGGTAATTQSGHSSSSSSTSSAGDAASSSSASSVPSSSTSAPPARTDQHGPPTSTSIRVDVQLHGHVLHHLPRTNSDYGILHVAFNSSSTAAEHHRGGEHMTNGTTAGNSVSSITEWGTADAAAAGTPGKDEIHNVSSMPSLPQSSRGAPTTATSGGGSSSTRHAEPVEAAAVSAAAGWTLTKHAHAHPHKQRHRGSLPRLAMFARRDRHMVALQLLGVGNALETAFLIIVTVFGVIVLILTTVQSLQSAITGGGASGEPAYCSSK